MTTSPMPLQEITVLVVDDSAVVRGMMTRYLEEEPGIKVVGAAANGKLALQTVGRLKPHVIILDIEMPEMDGITALPLLRKESPDSQVVIASTLSQRNAEISLRALELGAADYLPKPASKTLGGNNLQEFHRELIAKVKALGSRKPNPLPCASAVSLSAKTPPLPALAPEPPPPSVPLPAKPVYPLTRPTALAIGSSTGGPQALIAFFESIKGKLANLPVFLTQHMPPTFTAILAEHLARVSGRAVFEAEHGMTVKPGGVYVAKGDHHMRVDKKKGDVTLRLSQEPPLNFCRPSVDPMLQDLADIYGASLLVAIFTGMGQDGLEGAKHAVKKGASVIAQDEATSVVWGMPRAVAAHGLCNAVLPLKEIGPYILKACGEG